MKFRYFPRTPLREPEHDLEIDQLQLLDGHLFDYDWKRGTDLVFDVLDEIRHSIRPYSIPRVPKHYWRARKDSIVLDPIPYLERLNTCIRTHLNMPRGRAWEIVSYEPGGDIFCVSVVRMGYDPADGYRELRARETQRRRRRQKGS